MLFVEVCLVLDFLFKPSSIAVIGASRTPGKVGHEVLRNIVTSGFQGRVYPINPNASEVLGLKCYPSVREVEGPIDLCVVAVPAEVVRGIIDGIGAKHVKALIILSAGFRESGLEGARIEDAVMTVCRRRGIRVLGPNCLGLIDLYTPLNASFASTPPRKGNIAFISQSGALGTALLDWAIEEGIGFNKIVSLGNKADITETDLIQEFGDDDATKVIVVYLEGIEKGEEFLRVAQDVAQRKPLIILKSGVTSAGARAVSSHTGALAGSDLAYTTAFKHAGVIRVTTTEELFNLAEAFSTQPLPQGPNVAIITNAGGPGILATDACEKYGLRIAPIAASIVEQLRQQLPSAAGFFNPIDLLGDATAERYRFTLDTVLQSEDVHNALIILTPQVMTRPRETAETIVAVRRKFPEKPVVTSFLGGKLVEAAIATLEGAKTPNYAFPEKAVQALSALYHYTEYRLSPPQREIAPFEVDRAKVQALLKTVTDDGRATLKAFEAVEIVNAYGIPTPPLQFAATAEEAVTKAEAMGYPVVLKIESPQILHKTDVGGVKLDVASSDEVRTSFYELVGRAHIFNPRATILGVNVQKMIPAGREMIIGMNRDLTFGPMLMFGLGGIYVNFLKDVAFRLAPLCRESAWAMIEETKAYTLLRGIRGEPSSDIDAVVDVMLRVSQLVTDFTQINEMDINPLFVYERGKGCLALDVKMTIKPE
jgi:acetyl coenzyme A synthetase (ADP forming)-like protein